MLNAIFFIAAACIYTNVFFFYNCEKLHKFTLVWEYLYKAAMSSSNDEYRSQSLNGNSIIVGILIVNCICFCIESVRNTEIERAHQHICTHKYMVLSER